MFPLKRLAFVVVGVLVLLASGGWFLPRHAVVERSILIAAPREKVFQQVNGFGSFRQWSPWAERDPSMRPVAGTPASGVGARLAWDGDPAGVGSGTLEIVECRPPDLVRIDMDFGPQGRAISRFKLASVDGGTRVTWDFDMDLGFNPIARYFGLFFDKQIGPDYQRGLAGLKQWCERHGSLQGAAPSKRGRYDGSGRRAFPARWRVPRAIVPVNCCGTHNILSSGIVEER